MKAAKNLLIALLSAILAAILMTVAFAADPGSIIDKGSCGDKLTWTLTEDGVLEISGEGAMWDYEKEGNTAPWHQYLHEKENKTTLKLNEGITSIGGCAFYECYGLVGKLYIPGTVSVIGNFAFFQCPGLSGELIIPDSVTTIVGNAFSGCSGFKGSLTIPDSVTEIGWSAFQDCTGFSGNLSLSSNLERIEGYVFSGCTGLTGNLNIPYGVTEIEWGAFMDCSGFSGQLSIPSTVKFINSYAFAGCSHLSGGLYLPNSLTEIAWGAFKDCSGFTGQLMLPNGLTVIDGEVFKGCVGLSGEITFPSSLTRLWDGAFYGCDQISSFYFDGEAPEVGVLIFGERDDSFKVYCKLAYEESYTADEEYDKDSEKWHGYRLKVYGNSRAVQKKADEVTFAIMPSDGKWTADGTIGEGEYGEIVLDPAWMSYAMWSETELDYLMNLGEKLYMSWDSDYVYIASVYQPEVHSCTWDSEPELMWYSGCMQIGVASYEEKESEKRNEYGIGLSSETNQNLYCTWADGNGTGYSIGADDAKMFLSGGTITCESRIPWTAIYQNGFDQNTKGLNLCIVWSVGELQHYAHVQLASGITGYGKHAENYAKVSLITELDLLCEEVTEKLDEVINLAESGADAEEIKESVQEIGKDKLHEVMAADDANTGVVQQLQALEESTGATVSVDVAENVDDFDESLVSVVGALLNPLEQNEVTLNITQPQADEELPDLYDDAIAVRFGMELDGVQNPSDLAVPVKITLPIPESIEPARLIILHYPANSDPSGDGLPEEIITPSVFEKDGKWYASFILDHFSDFVMTMEKKIISGDLTGDGKVNRKDLAMLSKYLRNKEANPLDEKALLAANLNGDADVNRKDLAMLSKHLRNPELYPLS